MKGVGNVFKKVLVVLIVCITIVFATALLAIYKGIAGDAHIYLNSRNELVYRGPISETNADKLFDFYETLAEKPQILHITSSGGQGHAGGMIGDWVFENTLKVKVSRRCLSSCANYIFPAGLESQLTYGAILAWHGGFSSKILSHDKYGRITEEQIKDLTLSAPVSHQQLLDFERSYYEKIGVDPRLPTYGEHEDYTALNNGLLYNKNYKGFYYSSKDMAQMGIDVKLVDGKWVGDEVNNKSFADYYLATIKD